MITIFTPVYNRAYIIGRLYQSLLNQTNYEFEWLVVDDGSDDRIGELIDIWIKKENAPFKIRFYRQENGGKHRAVNKGVQLAEGDAFFIVDSDDYLAADAVELVYQWWKDIEKEEGYAGVSGLRGNKKGEVIGGTPLFEAYMDATNLERERYGLLGDKAEIYKTSVLKKYPFPEPPGEKFLTEAVVWDRIAYDGLKIRWFNKVIYICEYREDGLTNRVGELFSRNPVGWGIRIQQICDIYNLTAKGKIERYFEYYSALRESMTQDDMQNNLNIDDVQFAEVVGRHRECIEKTIDSIGKRIAVYGAGIRGRRVLSFYYNTEVEISYILDRRDADVPYRQVALSEHFPEVDAIIITPKKDQDGIAELLESKTKNRLLKYDEWRRCIGIDRKV